jgi:hypothetical protein
MVLLFSMIIAWSTPVRLGAGIVGWVGSIGGGVVVAEGGGDGSIGQPAADTGCRGRSTRGTRRTTLRSNQRQFV